MITINSSNTINRSPGQVFEFVSNGENARTWLGGWLETRPTSENERSVGSTWVDVVEVMGRRVETEFELTEFEPDQKIAFKSIRGSFPINGVYTFAPAGDATDVTFYLEGEPGGFFKLAQPLLARMLQRQWDTNLANIKDVMETAAP
jgi:uncharacterized protein YndB with AHSA1/START domain